MRSFDRVTLATVVFLGLSASAFAETSNDGSTKTTGNSQFGAECSERATTESTGTGSYVYQEHKTTTKIFGRSIKVLGVRGRVGARYAGNTYMGRTGTLTVELGSNGLPVEVGATLARNYRLVGAGAQLMIGPVPVYVEAQVAATLQSGLAIASVPNGIQIQTPKALGVTCAVQASLGSFIARVGVQGYLQPITLSFGGARTFKRPDPKTQITEKAYYATVGWAFGVDIVASVGRGWFAAEFRHPLYRSAAPYGNAYWEIVKTTTRTRLE